MYERLSKSGINYVPYRLENSKLKFRGPKPDLRAPFCAFIGGSETFGKFVERPFPVLVAEKLGMGCANFGRVNAGVDVFMNDSAVRNVCADARATVITVMGAHNLSNRFYSVHPRRNDRFIRASAMLKALYREMDFTDFNFTRHMLGALQDCSSDRFRFVVEEVQAAWLARMRALIESVGPKVVLLDLAEASDADDPLGPEPMFVTREMTEVLRALVPAVVSYRATLEPGPARTAGMVFDAIDAPAAAEMLPPDVHEAVAVALNSPVGALVQ